VGSRGIRAPSTGEGGGFAQKGRREDGRVGEDGGRERNDDRLECNWRDGSTLPLNALRAVF